MKKIIFIASTIFLFLIFLILLLTSLKKSKINNQNNPIISPTPFILNNQAQINEKSDRKNKIFLNLNNLNPLIENKLKTYLPYETEDFLVYYSEIDKKIVLIEKTSQAKEKFFQWLSQWIKNNKLEININNLTLELITSENKNETTFSLINNQLRFLKSTPTPIPPLDLGFFTIYFDDRITITPRPSLSSNHQNILNDQDPIYSSSTLGLGNVYYAQCNSPYADLPLPDGCTLCQSGCGTTTVAMISSSYLNNQYNPQFMINLYKQRGAYLGCRGSSYYDARNILESLGLRTTDYIYLNQQPADKVVEELKNYSEAGWTFFTLANFKENGGGHFFWITEIDNQGNIWAYDPYYGRFQTPPINQNSRYPFPKYRVAFGVKK